MQQVLLGTYQPLFIPYSAHRKTLHTLQVGRCAPPSDEFCMIFWHAREHQSYLRMTPTGMTCHAGEGLQQFAIVIEPLTSPPVLTSVILRFVLVACSFLDEATAKLSQPAPSEEPSNRLGPMSFHVTQAHEAQAPRRHGSESLSRTDSGLRPAAGSSTGSPQHGKRRATRQSQPSEQQPSDQPSYLPPGLTPVNSSDALSLQGMHVLDA